MFQFSAKSHHKWRIRLILRGRSVRKETKEGVRKTPILISIIISNHMQSFCFKFHQNRTINEEFDFLDGKGSQGVWGGSYSWILISIIIGKHTQLFCSKFHQNRTINVKFDFWAAKGVVLGAWGLQKLKQLKNIFPNIIEGCFCQKNLSTLFVPRFYISPVDYWFFLLFLKFYSGR